MLWTMSLGLGTVDYELGAGCSVLGAIDWELGAGCWGLWTRSLELWAVG